MLGDGGNSVATCALGQVLHQDLSKPMTLPQQRHPIPEEGEMMEL